jgi:hypothetical protein
MPKRRKYIYFSGVALKPLMMLVPSHTGAHTHIQHAGTLADLFFFEEIGETLPELDTEDIWRRGKELRIAFAHPLSVNFP